MKKQELEDKYFRRYLKWCVSGPKTDTVDELLFWIDYRRPNIDNFWDWYLRYYKKDILK